MSTILLFLMLTLNRYFFTGLGIAPDSNRDLWISFFARRTKVIFVFNIWYYHSPVKSCLWCQSCWRELSSYLYISFLMIHFFPIWFQWTETFQLFWISVCHFLNYGQNIMSLFAKATASMFIVKTWAFYFFHLHIKYYINKILFLNGIAKFW